MDKPRDMLLQLLTEKEPRLSVISVVGMGGLGKTTLARKVYKSSSNNYESNCRWCWMTVSQSPDIMRLLKNMGGQLNVPGLGALEEIGQIIEKIRDYLQAKRYVIVLDDIWSTPTWEDIRHAFPDNGLRSRIIVTTRHEDVATHCSTSEEYVYRLLPLSPEDSRVLFCKKLYKRQYTTSSSIPPHLEELCKDILRKCGGRPLAIVTIGALLATKPPLRNEWEKLHKNLGSKLGSNSSLEDMRWILTLSYNDLPYYLKPCFLYMSMFPEDFSIGRSRLLRLWMAEGFARGTRNMTAEEVAEDYFQELVNRSLIQPWSFSHSGKVKECRIHDVILDVITTKSLEENFVGIGDDKVRRLSLRDSDNCNLSSSIRSLIGFGYGDKSITFHSRSVLRVLDLEECRQSERHNLDKFGILIHLRYLSLSGTGVRRLQDSLGELTNLETLDIRDTGLTRLPSSIIKLRKLRHLLAGFWPSRGVHPEMGVQMPRVLGMGVKMPRGMGSLKALETLVGIDISEGAIEELAELRQLRKLIVFGLTMENELKFWSAIEKVSGRLRTLGVLTYPYRSNVGITRDYMITPPLNLVSLRLESHIQALPPWFARLENVAKMVLGYCELGDEILQALQALPNLTFLSLEHNAYNGQVLCFGAQGFPSLKEMRLLWLFEMKTLIFEERSLRKLEKLVVGECRSLKVEDISGIEHLASLKEVEVVRQSQTSQILGIWKRKIGANPRHPKFSADRIWI